MKYATLLLALSAATLLGCGKSEETAAPAAPPPAAEAPQVGTAPAATPEPAAPAVETPLPEAAPAKQPEAPLEPPVAAGKPAPATSAPAARAPGAPAPDLARGQQIYRQACAFCHDKGVAGAPKTGDAAAWSPRLAQGMDTLYTVSLRGKGAMPAKGGNPSLADADVKAAVDYMVAQSR